MQSAANLKPQELELMTAQELREVTVTESVLYNRRKENLLQDLMGTMVRLATEQGRKNYSAQVQAKQFDTKLLEEVIEAFKGRGYTVSTADKVTNMTGTPIELIELTIDWNEVQ